MHHLSIPALTFVLCVPFSTPVAAQAFNIDIGDPTYGAPSAAYGAASGQTGQWVAVDGALGGIGLTDITGAATSVDLSIVGGVGNFYFNNGATTGDDELLMDDLHDAGAASGSFTEFKFTGLQDGSYLIYTYAWPPDNTLYQTEIEVVGSPDPPELVGFSAWPGGHVRGDTYAVHTVTVSGGVLDVKASIYANDFGSLNGFQIVPAVQGIAYCYGNTGSGNPCPCGNDNDGTLPLGGCQHDDSLAGARLDLTGIPSVASDSVVLLGSRGPIQNSTLFFQANNNLDGTGAFLGDGIRCAGGGLIRLKVKTTDANGDADSTPMIITARSASFGHPIQPGETLYYQWWIRDSNGSSCGAESNTSNGIEVTWGP